MSMLDYLRETRRIAFREGLFAGLLDDGFTPEYAENRDQELNPYQGAPRD